MHPSVVYRGSGSNTPHTACAYMLPPDTFVIACTKFDDVAIGRCSANRHVRKAVLKVSRFVNMSKKVFANYPTQTAPTDAEK